MKVIAFLKESFCLQANQCSILVPMLLLSQSIFLIINTKPKYHLFQVFCPSIASYIY